MKQENQLPLRGILRPRFLVRVLAHTCSFLIGVAFQAYIARVSRVDTNIGGSEHSRRSFEDKTTFDPCTTGIARGVPTFKLREDLGIILEAEGLHIGAELGVQHAYFSKTLLSAWVSNREYHLVDVWAKQENYVDVANKGQSEQDEIYAAAMENVKPWKSNIHVCRNFTTNCVHNYEDDHFDFIYVDARHDFKGVLQDMQLWWPKLKQVGGARLCENWVDSTDHFYSTSTPTFNCCLIYIQRHIPGGYFCWT